LWRLQLMDFAVNCKYSYLNSHSRTNGEYCTVLCDQQVLEEPPPVDSVVTVKYTGTNADGTLKHAHFWREKPDILV